jgi:hypothetical protein
METPGLENPPQPAGKTPAQAAVMALARIITRSQICSRELSLALVARGYTVEIVSPDKVPDDIADLELRVEASPENELIANVEAHNGGHTTSLEFVHHLNAPVLDFLRRPSERSEAAHTSGETVSFVTRAGNKGRALLAEDPQPFLRAAATVETLPPRKANAEIDPAEGATLLAPQNLTLPEDSPDYFAVEGAALPQPALILRPMIPQAGIQQAVIRQTVIRLATVPSTLAPRTSVPQRMMLRTMGRKTMAPPTQAGQESNWFSGWPWRAGLAFAIVVLLSVVVGFGMRRSSDAAGQSSLLPVGRNAAAPAGNPSSAGGIEKNAIIDLGQISSGPWGPLAAESEANSVHAPEEAQVVKSRTPTTSPRTALSRKRDDDFVARDFTIYFDKRFEPARKAKPAKPIARRRG